MISSQNLFLPVCFGSIFVVEPFTLNPEGICCRIYDDYNFKTTRKIFGGGLSGGVGGGGSGLRTLLLYNIYWDNYRNNVTTVSHLHKIVVVIRFDRMAKITLKRLAAATFMSLFKW